MDGTVMALAMSGGDLHAGGAFTAADGRAANSIAKWNESGWIALGSGMNWIVRALAVSGNDLFVGGGFIQAGGSKVNYIVKWNGSAWSPLGAGMNGDVWTLAVSDSSLFAGGSFTAAGGTPASFIAQWNGSAWRPLGSGINSSMYALAVSGSDLYAGGVFTTAGGKVSGYVAKAIAIPGDWLNIARDVPGPNTNTLSFVGVPGESYTIQFTTNVDTPNWLPLVTTNADSNGRAIVLDPDATAPQRFYRVTSP